MEATKEEEDKMKMRIRINKIGSSWIGKYVLPEGRAVIVESMDDFEFFCRMLRASWNYDAQRARGLGWRIDEK